MKILSYRRFALWWQLAMDWFQRQFAAIAASIDFTPLAKDATVAKQGTNPDATNTAILAAFDNIDFSTLAKQGTNANATLTAVLEALTGSDDPSPDIPEGVAERLAMILQFFGLPEALPGSYTALTQAEVIASTRAEQVNAWGEDGCPIPDYLPVGVTEAMVEAAATALGITYYEPNFNIATL